MAGSAGVGKTSLVRMAALLAGRKLTEIALTGGTDTADLLGGFEQLEAKRKVQVSQRAVRNGVLGTLTCCYAVATSKPCPCCSILPCQCSNLWSLYMQFNPSLVIQLCC